MKKARGSGLYDIPCHKHHATDKAWKLSDDGVEANHKWVPKSAGELVREGTHWILTVDQEALEKYDLEDWVQ